MEVWGAPKIIVLRRKRRISMSSFGLKKNWVKNSNGKWFYVQMKKSSFFVKRIIYPGNSPLNTTNITIAIPIMVNGILKIACPLIDRRP